jgi:hypothetical protein
MFCSFSGNIPIWVTEVLTLRDPRRHDIRFKDALRKEIDGLVQRGTWNVMCMRDVSPAVILLGGRFVLSIKNKDTSEETIKGSFCSARAHGCGKAPPASLRRNTSLPFIAIDPSPLCDSRTPHLDARRLLGIPSV